MEGQAETPAPPPLEDEVNEAILASEEATGTSTVDDSRRNLIVNYVPSSLSEEALKGIFMPFGELESCKLMVDKIDGHSLGYGFVKFLQEDSAAQAIAVLNGKQIESKRLKVSYARPASPAIQNANLYISRLDPEIAKEHLDRWFAAFGQIVDSKVLKDPKTGGSRGVGFVRYANQQQAQAAITGLNGVQLAENSQPIQVKFAEVMEEKMRRRRNNALLLQPTLYAQTGARYAPYVQPSIYGGGLLAQPAVFGFAAPTQPLQPQYRATAGYCVFVYNLPPTTTEDLMYQLFSPYGAVLNVKVIRDISTSLCKGYGFVNYAEYEDAVQAIQNLNTAELGGKRLQVSFKTQKNQ